MLFVIFPTTTAAVSATVSEQYSANAPRTQPKAAHNFTSPMPKPLVRKLTAISGRKSPNKPTIRSTVGVVLMNGLARMSITGAKFDISW